MSTDLASIGIEIDATSGVKAAQDMDRAEASGAKLARTSDVVTQSMVNQNAAMLKASQAYYQHSAAMEGLSDAAQRVINRYEPLGAHVRSLEADFARLNKEVAAGAGAGQEGAIDLTYRRLNEEIARTEGLMKTAGAAGAEGFGKIASGGIAAALSTAQARRELIVLGHEAMVGNFSRIPGSLLVLGERLGVTGAGFAMMAAPILGVVGALGALITAAVKGGQEMTAMNNALVMTNNYAGLTRGGMLDLAETVSSAGRVTIGTAKGIVETLVESGRIGSKSISAIAELAANYARATGGNIDKIAADMVKLFENPAKGAETLNDKMHFLNTTELEYIDHLVRIGDLEEARLVLADKLKDQVDQTVHNLGALQTAWNAIKNAAGGAWDAMLNLGRTATSEQALRDQQQTVDALNAKIAAGGLSGHDPRTAAALAAATTLLATMKQTQATAEGIATAHSKAAQANEREALAMKEIDKSQTHQITVLRNKLTLISSAPDSVDKARRELEIHKQIAAIEKSIAKVPKGAGPDQALLERIKGEEKLYEISIRSQLEQNDAQLKLGNLTKQEHDQMTMFLNLERNLAQQNAVAKELAVHNISAKERQAFDSRMTELKAEADAIKQRGGDQDLIDQQAAADAVAKSYAAMEKAINSTGDAEIKQLTAVLAAQKLHNSEIGKTAAMKELEKQKAYDAGTVQIEADIQSLEIEKVMYGLHGDALKLYDDEIIKLTAIVNLRQQISAGVGDAAAQEASAAAAHAYYREWSKALEFVDRGLSGFFVSMLEHGSSSFKQLWDNFKKWAFEVFAQIAAKQIIVSIVGALGMGGAAGAAASALTGSNAVGSVGNSGIGSISNLISDGSSLYSGAGTIGSIGSAAALGYGGIAALGGSAVSAAAVAGGTEGAIGALGALGAAGDVSALGAVGVAGSATAGGGIMAGLSAGLAAVPVVGWIALAAVVIYGILSGMKNVPATRFGDFASNTALGAGNPLFQGKSAFGTYGVSNDHWFSNSDMGPAMQAMLTSINQLDNSVSAIIGKDATGRVTSALQTSKTYGFGTEHTDLNASGAVGAILTDRYTAVLNVLDTRLGAVIHGFHGTGAELGKLVVELARLDTVTNKLPADIRNKIFNLLDSTVATADKMMAFATAYKTVQDALNADPMAAGKDAYTASLNTAYSAMLKQGDALALLGQTYDGSTAASQRLTSSTAAYYQAVVQMIAGIEQAKVAIGSMFDATIRNIQLSAMTPAQKYAYYQRDAQNAYGQLQTATDPNRINALSGQINQDINSSYGLLSPQEQQQQSASFISAATRANDLAQQRLQKVEDAAVAREQQLMTDLRTVLTEAIAKMNTAATTQVSAANTQQAAANTPLQVHVNVTGTTGAEVGVG